MVGSEACLAGSDACLAGSEACLAGSEACLAGSEACLAASEAYLAGFEACLAGSMRLTGSLALGGGGMDDRMDRQTDGWKISRCLKTNKQEPNQINRKTNQ